MIKNLIGNTANTTHNTKLEAKMTKQGAKVGSNDSLCVYKDMAIV